MKRIVVGVVVLLLLAGLYVGGMALRLYGSHRKAGEPTSSPIPPELVASRARDQQRGAAGLSSSPTRQILFGDLHVHTTFSTDAFVRSLPMMGGEGAHPVADACDFARFCSALDFWSINDHAEASTPQRWQETIDSIRQCNAIGSDDRNPDVTAFLGWEWSQVGRRPEDHYGHKNVVLRGLGDDEIPARPIGAGGLATDALRGAAAVFPALMPLLDLPNRQPYYDFIRFMQEIQEVPRCEEGVDTRELPDDCYESAAEPGELFEKLAQWGFDSIVIPHGNTWGFYSPPAITLDKQLTAAQNDPSRQMLFEIMSGHGSSEEYRDWRAARVGADGEPYCPEPTPDYLPSCWRAGEIIEARCLAEDESASECAARAAEARLNYVLGGAGGHLSVPGAEAADWLDSGQCRDCFLPSFNYRPGGSAQYALAISNADDPDEPKRFRFGFIASSDNHTARPGTGFKEFGRRVNTEATGAVDEAWRRRMFASTAAPEARSQALVEEEVVQRGLRALEGERQAAFFMTGGLAAAHSDGRDRDSIWAAFLRKEVYGTSGPRILLWFNLLNAERPDGRFGPVTMGGETRMARAPRFEVRAVGSFEQKPGCPDYSVRALDAEELSYICANECYNPSDQRRLISRIEVVRVRPQRTPGESVAPLIEDPWRVIECAPSQAGCAVQFEDPDFVAGARDTAYYVRAVEQPGLAVNAGNLRCRAEGDDPCAEVDICYGDYRTPRDDDCLAPSEERAWSSPIFVDHPAAGSS